jgi:hypothetical protein
LQFIKDMVFGRPLQFIKDMVFGTPQPTSFIAPFGAGGG